MRSTRHAVRLVVLGDSISRGVGASVPRRSLVGRVADYIALETDRPVHIANYSQSGATANDVLNKQIPRVDLQVTDVILLEIGVNDSYRRTVKEFQQDLGAIIKLLPLNKTIIADIPFSKIRRPYQKIAHVILSDKRIIRATVSEAFVHFIPAFWVTSGDFFHPNDKGYKLWFEAFRPGIDTILQRSNLLKSERK